MVALGSGQDGCRRKRTGWLPSRADKMVALESGQDGCRRERTRMLAVERGQRYFPSGAKKKAALEG